MRRATVAARTLSPVGTPPSMGLAGTSHFQPPVHWEVHGTFSHRSSCPTIPRHQLLLSSRLMKAGEESVEVFGSEKGPRAAGCRPCTQQSPSGCPCPPPPPNTTGSRAGPSAQSRSTRGVTHHPPSTEPPMKPQMSHIACSPASGTSGNSPEAGRFGGPNRAF